MMTEDDIRAALTLLEQRAPDTPADLPRLRTGQQTNRSHRHWVLPLTSVAAVIALGVTAALVLPSGRHTHPAGIGPTTAPTASTASNPDVTSCLQNPAPRIGINQSMVPGTPVSVTICQYPDGHKVSSQTENIAGIVQALNKLPTNPVGHGCVAASPGSIPALNTYELHFHYLSGPDVEVNLLPGCRPGVDNIYGLSATNALPAITAVLAAHAQPTPTNPSTSTSRPRTSRYVRVPQLVGRTKASAINQIGDVGLTYRIVVTHNPSVTAGAVVSQAPAEGTTVLRGSVITFTLDRP